MNNKLLYIHNANFDDLNANKIQVLNMCDGFIQNNANVELIAFGSKDIIKKKYIFSKKLKFTNLQKLNNYYFRSIILIIKALKKIKKFDIIYSRDLFFSCITTLLFPKKRIYYEIHEVHKNKLWLFLIKTLAKKKGIISISQGIVKDLQDNGIEFNEYKVLPDGVSEDYFLKNYTRIQARKELKLPKEKSIVLYIGGIRDWKGYDTYLKSTHQNNDIIFYCIGGNDKQNKELKKEYPQVIFKKFQSQKKVPLWLKAANILILPNSGKFKISKYYTSPLKLFEYMSSKTPIIASDLPSIREIVSEKEVVFFKPDNDKDLKEKTLKLLLEKELKKELCLNAFKKVKEYTWKKRASHILKNEF